MKEKVKRNSLKLIVLLSLISLDSYAEDVLSIYKNTAKADNPKFANFSIEEGKKLYFLERTNSKGAKISCTLCHTSDAKEKGKTRAGKIIEAMAPRINPERFTEFKQVEKWFLRNCRDVLDRECTPIEKGNFITYLKSL